MIYGVDVSYENGQPDWQTAKAQAPEKVGFAYCRATYGTNPNYDDGPIFTWNHDQCKALGIPTAAYTFWLAGQDPEEQAQHFLSAIDGREGVLAPMVDVEEGSGAAGWLVSIQARIDALAMTLTAIQKALKTEPVIYTNADTWENYFGGTDAFSGHRLVIAAPSDPPGSPALPHGFSTWAAHQFSFTGSIPGFSGHVDLDCCVDLDDISR